MGKYYNGDINGKFWVGVQSSDDADYFGVEGYNTHLTYYYDEDNLNDIREGVANCVNELDMYKDILDKFFKDNDSYDDEMLVKAGIPKGKVRTLLVWYARLELGNEILKCVEENGCCEFEAEL